MGIENVPFKYNGITLSYKTMTLPLGTAWMGLEDAIETETSQTQKHRDWISLPTHRSLKDWP